MLVQYGSANFDSMSGTAAVQTLLKGLDQSGVLSHVKFICGVLAHAASTVPASEEQGENAAAEEEEEEERDGEAVAVQAVQALVLLAKNTQLGVPRVLMNTLVLGLLMRVGCFEAEAVLAEGAKSGGKKAKKGKLSEGDAALRDCVALLEQGSGEGLDAGEAAAGSKLLSMLAELGHVECVDPVAASAADAASTDAHKSSGRGPVYLDEAVRLLRQFMAAGGALRRAALEEDADAAAAIVQGAVDCYAATAVTAAVEATEGEGRRGRSLRRAVDSVRRLLAGTLLHALVADHVDLQLVADLTELTPGLIGLLEQAGEGGAASTGPSVQDTDELLPRLFELSTALLSVQEGDVPVRGLREALKGAWGELCGRVVVGKELLERAVDSVVGGAGGEEDEGAEEEGGDEGAELEGDQDDDGSEAGAEGPADNKEEAGGEDVEEGEDEGDDEDDDSGDEGGSDAALADMINMRKQNRKQGQVEAARRDLLQSTRHLDLLEVI